MYDKDTAFHKEVETLINKLNAQERAVIDLTNQQFQTADQVFNARYDMDQSVKNDFSPLTGITRNKHASPELKNKAERVLEILHRYDNYFKPSTDKYIADSDWLVKHYVKRLQQVFDAYLHKHRDNPQTNPHIQTEKPQPNSQSPPQTKPPEPFTTPSEALSNSKSFTRILTHQIQSMESMKTTLNEIENLYQEDDTGILSGIQNMIKELNTHEQKIIEITNTPFNSSEDIMDAHTDIENEYNLPVVSVSSIIHNQCESVPLQSKAEQALKILEQSINASKTDKYKADTYQLENRYVKTLKTLLDRYHFNKYGTQCPSGYDIPR